MASPASPTPSSSVGTMPSSTDSVAACASTCPTVIEAKPTSLSPKVRKSSRRIILLLDETKNMQPYTFAFQQGFNTFLTVQRYVNQQMGHRYRPIDATVLKFDSVLNEYAAGEIGEISMFENRHDYSPSYGMPRNRVLSSVVDRFRKNKITDEDEKNTIVIMVTDGHIEKLDSSEAERLRQKTDQIKKDQGWRFVYCSAPYNYNAIVNNPNLTAEQHQQIFESTAQLYNFDMTYHLATFHQLWLKISDIVLDARKIRSKRRKNTESSSSASRRQRRAERAAKKLAAGAQQAGSRRQSAQDEEVSTSTGPASQLEPTNRNMSESTQTLISNQSFSQSCDESTFLAAAEQSLETPRVPAAMTAVNPLQTPIPDSPTEEGEDRLTHFLDRVSKESETSRPGKTTSLDTGLIELSTSKTKIQSTPQLKMSEPIQIKDRRGYSMSSDEGLAASV